MVFFKHFTSRLSIVLVSCTTILTACSTMNEDECRNANWSIIGQADASHGYSKNRIADHQKACSEYGVQPDLTKYNAGYQEGLKTFCTPNNGYSEGRKNRRYGNQCPKKLEAAFLKAYKQGKAYYDLESEIRPLEYKSNSLHQKIDEKTTTIDNINSQLKYQNIPANKRLQLLGQVDALKSERSKLKNESKTNDQKLHKLQKKLAALPSQPY